MRASFVPNMGFEAGPSIYPSIFHIGEHMKIFKYKLEIKDQYDVLMHKDADIIKIDYQGGKPFLWAIVNTELPIIWRRFTVVPTGGDIPIHWQYTTKFVGTVLSPGGGELVWHVFEKIYKEEKEEEQKKKETVSPDELRIGTLKRCDCEIANLLDDKTLDVHWREIFADLRKQVLASIKGEYYERSS